MQCDYLVEFSTIAQTGSLTRAAAQLSLSQSCLSRHLSALEAELGVKLARRLPTGIELTPMGRYIANRAVDIAEIIEGIEDYVAAQRPDECLFVGGFTVMPTQMGRLVKKGRSLGEPAQVQIMPPGSFAADEINHLFAKGSVDAYITIASDTRLQSLSAGLKTRTLFRSRYVAVMESHHPLAARESLVRSDLAGALLLHAESAIDGECLNWDDTKRVMQEANVECLARTVTFDNVRSFYGDFKNGICLLPEDYSAIATLRQAGKAVVAIEDAFMQIVAVHNPQDTRVVELLDAAFPQP